MVVTEIIEINGKQLCKHYSNENKIIIQVETQTEYAEAIDIMPCPYTYVESDKDIEQLEEELNGNSNT